MPLKKAVWICYLSSLIIVYSGIFLSVYLWGDFDWSYNALSDLGTRENTAMIFNTSLILGGLLFAVFGGFLLKLVDEFPEQNLAVNIVLAGISLLFVGVFPSSSVQGVHILFALLYFFFLLVIMTNIFTIYHLKKLKIRCFSFASIFIFIISGLLYSYIGLATSEIISSTLAVINIFVYLYIFHR